MVFLPSGELAQGGLQPSLRTSAPRGAEATIKRKRGSQPRNTNARKHGFYAARRPHRAVRTISRLDVARSIGALAFGIGEQDVLLAQIAHVQRIIANTMAAALRVDPDSKDSLIKTHVFLHALQSSVRLKVLYHKLQQENDLLETLAEQASYLCNAEFASQGISEYPLFVPLRLGKNRGELLGERASGEHRLLPLHEERKLDEALPLFREAPCKGSEFSRIRGDREAPCKGSEFSRIRGDREAPGTGKEGGEDERKLDEALPMFREAPWKGSAFSRIRGERPKAKGGNPQSEIENQKSVCLTDDQWFLLQPLLISLRKEQAAARLAPGNRKYAPRLSRYPDRLLLDGILWKLAAAARWQDLPPHIPVRACQLLYKTLCDTGRMAAIYTHLGRHLLEFGQTSLTDLVRAGVFKVMDDRILLATDNSLTWEKYTALLLLQRALFNQRAERHRADHSRRGSGLYYRLPRAGRRQAAAAHSRPMRDGSQPDEQKQTSIFIPLQV